MNFLFILEKAFKFNTHRALRDHGYVNMYGFALL